MGLSGEVDFIDAGGGPSCLGPDSTANDGWLHLTIFLPILTVCGLTACQQSSLIHVKHPWPPGEVAIAAILTSEYEVAGGPWLIEDFNLLKVSAEPPAAGRLVVWTFPASIDGGPDFSKCGIQIVGAKDDLTLTPSNIWSSELSDFSIIQEVSLEPIPGGLPVWITHASTSCRDRKPDCGQPQIQRLDPGIVDTRISALSYHRHRGIYYLAHGDSPDEIQVGFFDSRDTIIRSYPATSSISLAASMTMTTGDPPDYQTNIYVTADDGTLLRLDEDLMVLERRKYPPSTKVAKGGETIWIYGPDGIENYYPTRGDAIPSYPGPRPVKSLAASLEGQLLVLADSQLYYFDGTSWQQEYLEENGVSWRQVALEATRAMIVGAEGRTLARDVKTGQWQPWPQRSQASLSIDLNTISFMDGDRFIVAGKDGFIQWWNGSRWCPSARGAPGTIKASIRGSRPGEIYLGGDDRLSSDQDSPVLLRWSVE